MALHQRVDAFIIPNPWDAGSARLLARMGFEALATTSAGFAFSLGKQDTAVSRDEMVAHVAVIAAATSLPVSADLENGYADAPRDVVETYLRAADAGAVGGSIEDATNNAEDPIHEIELAAERVRAVAEAVHALPCRFTLTARAENFLHGRPDLADTIARLQAYQEAGADVLYAPGLTTSDEIAAVVRAVDRPVNVLAGIPGFTLDRAALDSLGVRRISIGSGLARAALGAFLRASAEMHDRGSFSFMEDAVPFAQVMGMLKTD
jgi:2-methylisocitrate lyase-like PEP mutase family enzyme